MAESHGNPHQGIEVNISDKEEEEILYFDDEDIKSGVEDCSRSLVARLLTDKSFSLGTIESTLGAI